MSKLGIISLIAISFAHKLGKFDVVFLFGGKIPGNTKVISTANYVHLITYAVSHMFSEILLLFLCNPAVRK